MSQQNIDGDGELRLNLPIVGVEVEVRLRLSEVAVLRVWGDQGCNHELR